MAHQEQQPNSEKDPRDARPSDPESNTRPRGNGDQDEGDTQRGKEKLYSVLGQ